MKHILTCILMISIAAVSCNNKCSSATANISLVSFQPNETDTVLVRKFLKLSGFTTLLDSFSINQSNAHYINKNDTLEISYSFGMDQGLLGKYDYEIYLPRIQKIYRVSEIDEDFQSGFQGLSCTKEQCLNSFKSYKVNGEKIAVSSLYTFYFVK